MTTGPLHHPSDAVLTDYASGAMRPAFAVVTAAHLEACDRCRATLAGLEALGGEMIADLPQSSLSEEALPRAMAGIERPVEGAPMRSPMTVDRVPFGRKIWIGPGMHISKAKMEGGDLLYRLSLPAGQATFPHDHNGLEFTAVLTGAFNDGFETYAAGDFAEANPNFQHKPNVTPDAGCICLIASERPLIAGDLIGRIIQLVARV
jgi:putative transcriptional regulator